jgi:hypothetical protein
MKIVLTILLLISPSMLVAQTLSDGEVLARVGGEEITVGEFRARYALGVFPYKDQERLTPVIKTQFLYSLIAERLLMVEARRLGFDAEDRFRRNRRLAAEMFMRDRLYRDSVRARIAVSEEEIRARFMEELERVQFDFLYSAKESDIRNLHRLLQGGIPFDTLLVEQQRAAGEGDHPAPRSDGIDPAFRARIDALAPGAVSRPMQAADGWYLVRKMDYGNPIRSEYELQKRTHRIETQLRTEKEEVETIAFVRRLWNGKEARFEEEPYRMLAQALLEDYRTQARADTSDMLIASVAVFDSLRALWALRLEEPFLHISAKIRDGDTPPLGIGDALDRLQASDLRLAAKELAAFPALYRTRTRELADRYLLTREAYRLALDQHPDVQTDLAMWTANGLAQMMPELLWEQFIASDDSLWNYYVSRPDLFGPPVEVKIVEVLTQDDAVMQQVVDAFRDGASLHQLAVRYSARQGASDRNGELGFFPVTYYGGIGRTAFGLRIADAAGPINTADGQSFFQLVDKRYPGKPIGDWRSLRDTASAVIRSGLVRSKTDALLRALASRGGISVNVELLNRVSVPSMQMFSIRSLGFGGRIPAVPAVAPLYEAVMEGMGMQGGVAP